MFQSPAPFVDAEPAAFIRDGRRTLSWRLNEPDGATFEKNRFVWLWAEVSEDRMLAGEPSTFTCSRRLEEDAPRSTLTDAARTKLRTMLFRAVSEYGFDRLWTEITAAGFSEQAGHHRSSAQTARQRAAFFDGCSDLAEMLGAGCAELRPVDGPDPTGRCQTVRVAGHSRDWSWVAPLAKIVVDGEHVGWLTENHGPVPCLEMRW